MSLFDPVVAGIAKFALTSVSRMRLPKVKGTVKLPGLKHHVEVIRDTWAVPHIYAENPYDLFFAQGFIHAQERLWQMELNRRAALGRLSEVFGEITLKTDRAVRIFGFNRLAQADWGLADNETRSVVLAYVEGINAFLESNFALPVEFSLARFRPEKWQPVDCTAFARLFMSQLTWGWYAETVRARLVQAVGEHAAELEIHYPPENPLTLPRGIELNPFNGKGSLSPSIGPFVSPAMGSNSWVVSGQRSVTGRPYLCNDMHLAESAPSRWYENHLVGGGYDVTGASLPGVPLVIIGHDASIAWGCTLALTDCEDLFMEKISGSPPEYEFESAPREAEIVPEPIKIKGSLQPFVEKVVITRHGPLISDIIGYSEHPLALNSMALRPSLSLRGWRKLNLASGWNEFVDAVRYIDAPPLNVTYADTDGNIGYWMTGKVPVRARGQGMVPVPGWTGDYEWTGEVPFEEMPHAMNPEDGYIVTCNNRVMPPDYPHFLGNCWMNGYRARRLTDLIDAKQKLGVEDFRAMCLDVTCLPALDFVRLLGYFETADEDAAAALKMLRSWDGRLFPESAAAALYEVTRFHLVRNLLEPGLGHEMTICFMGSCFNPVLKAMHEFYGHDTVVMLRILSDADSWWLQQAGGRHKVTENSLGQSYRWLREKFGPDEKKWSWGRMHSLTFPHTMGIRKPLDTVFNRGPYPIGGDTDTPLQTALAAENPYETLGWAPTYKQIVDMGDLSRSLSIHAPGQSGNIGSRHYDDFIEPWFRGDYHPMLWDRESVERHAAAVMILKS